MATRPILTAELLSIGTELTVGETRDTNAGDLARSPDRAGRRRCAGSWHCPTTSRPCSTRSVDGAGRRRSRRVDGRPRADAGRPDPRGDRRRARRDAGGRSGAGDLAARDLVATRAALPRDEPQAGVADPVGDRAPQPERHGARLVGGASRRRADRGAARAAARDGPDVGGRGPARGCPSRGVGVVVASRTLRLAGIGESQVADLLGEALLRADGSDRRDIRPLRRGRRPDLGAGDGADGSLPAARVDATADRVATLLAGHVWAEGATSWPEAIGAALAEHRGSLAVVEVGTAGSLAALLGDRDWLDVRRDARPRHPDGQGARDADGPGASGPARTRARRGDARHRGASPGPRLGHGRVGRRRRAGLGSSRAADRVPRRRQRPEPGRARGGPRRA